MLSFCGCVFFLISLWFVYLRIRMSSNPMPESIAGVPFDSVGRFRTSQLLRTTYVRSYCDRIASCVAA